MIVKDYSKENYNINQYTAVALGNFDGFHIGHKSLLDNLILNSKRYGLSSAIFTFNNHPKSINNNLRLITPMDEKYDFLKDQGLDFLFLHDFNHIKNLSPENFFKEIIINSLRAKLLVVGFDYRFGYKASGDTELLKKLCKENDITLIVQEPIKIDDEKVSSTLIRNYLKDGKIKKSNKLLGRYFKMRGFVKPGKQIGRKLGFPTANIEISKYKVYPKVGVYASFVKIEGNFYKAATLIGKAPSIKDGDIIIESYILNFDEEIYNKEIEIYFVKHIRDEIKFEDISELKNQIKKDVNLIEISLHINYDMIN